MGFRVSGTGSRVSMEGTDNGSVLMEGELLDLCCTNCQEVMLPNTQSITDRCHRVRDLCRRSCD